MKEKIIMEFSERWLKAAVVEQHGAGPGKVKGLYREAIQPDALSFSDAITRIYAQAGKKKFAETAVVIGRSKVTVRRIDLPSRDNAEIGQMLGLHVIRHVPYPKEEIIWAYHNLGFDGISNSHILLAIAHRDILRNVFNSFVSLGIQPESMLLSSQGAVHYARLSAKDPAPFQQVCLVLDIDNASSELMVVNKLQLSSSVVISQGAEGLASEGGPVRFVMEFKQALSAFRDELSAQKDITVFVTGVAGGVEEIGGYLEKEMGLKVCPLQSPATDSTRDISFASALGFSGPARKDDIGFVLPEIQVKKEMKQKLRQLLVLGVCGIYVFIMAALVAFSFLSQREAYLGKVTLAVKLLKSRNEGLADVSRMVELARPYMEARLTPLTVLYEMDRLCPENIVLTNFVWDRKKGLVIRGYAYEMPDIFSFVNALDNAPLFKGMKTRSTRRHKIKDREVVDFEIGAK